MSDYHGQHENRANPAPDPPRQPAPRQVPGARPCDAAVRAAIDHVRLSYLYLDAGDTDGYASLFEHGSALPWRAAAAVRHGRHVVETLVADGERIVATGHVAGGQQPGPVRFVDVFTVSASGLLRSKAAYHSGRPERR